MPLHIQARRMSEDAWSPPAVLSPEDHPGSMSSNTPGGRDIYFFACLEGDAKSVIYRSGAGADVDTAQARIIYPDDSRITLVKELVRGESHEMEVLTDRGTAPLFVRFSHV